MPGFGRVLARLFMLQAAWNYERMQGVGFGNAVEPALRTLEGGEGGPRYRAALARQAQFFNAHPYFAGLAVGAAVRAEVDGAPPERIAKLREALCGPLGSLGDRLFWASWLPSCAAIGVGAFVLGARLWAAVLFLVLYNAAHIGCRIWALRAGWDRGLAVAGALNGPVLRLMARVAAPLAGVMVGAALPLFFMWRMAGATSRAYVAAGLGAVAVAAILALARARITGVALAALLLGATWIVGWIAW